MSRVTWRDAQVAVLVAIVAMSVVAMAFVTPAAAQSVDVDTDASDLEIRQDSTYSNLTDDGGDIEFTDLDSDDGGNISVIIDFSDAAAEDVGFEDVDEGDLDVEVDDGEFIFNETNTNDEEIRFFVENESTTADDPVITKLNITDGIDTNNANLATGLEYTIEFEDNIGDREAYDWDDSDHGDSGETNEFNIVGVDEFDPDPRSLTQGATGVEYTFEFDSVVSAGDDREEVVLEIEDGDFDAVTQADVQADIAGDSFEIHDVTPAGNELTIENESAFPEETVLEFTITVDNVENPPDAAAKDLTVTIPNGYSQTVSLTYLDQKLDATEVSDLVFDDDERSQTFQIDVAEFDQANEVIFANSSTLEPIYDDSGVTADDVDVRKTGAEADDVTVDEVRVLQGDDNLYELHLDVDNTPVEDVTLTVVVDDLDTSDDASPLAPGLIDDVTVNELTPVRTPAGLHAENAAHLDDGDIGYVDKAFTITEDTTMDDGTDVDTLLDGKDEVDFRRVEIDGGDRTYGERIQRPGVRTADSGDQWVRIRTAGIDTGEYVVDIDEGANRGDEINNDEAVTFEVLAQDLDVEWEEDTVSSADRYNDVELELASDARASYNVKISADGLDYEELEDLFGDETENDVPRAQPQGDQPRFDQREDDDEITLGADDELIANFSAAELDAGEYEFEIEVTDADASATATIEVEDEDVDADFDQGVYEYGAGDLLEVTVEFGDTDDAYVVIGDEDVGFIDLLYVEDDEDNNEATFYYNTRIAGTGYGYGDEGDHYDAPVVHSPEDDVAILHPDHDLTNDDDPFAGVRLYDDDDFDGGDELATQTLTELRAEELDLDENLIRPLMPGDYELTTSDTGNLAADDDELVIEEELDVATLDLMRPEATAVNTWVAPEDDADEDDLEELLERITERNEVAIDDRLVVEVEARGLYGHLQVHSGEDPEDMFEDGVSSDFFTEGDVQPTGGANETGALADGIDFEIEQTNERANQQPHSIQFDAGEDAVLMLPSPDQDRFFIVADTSDGDITDRDRDIRDGAEFDASIEYETDDDDRFRFYVDDSFDSTSGQDDHISTIFGAAGGDSNDASYPYYRAGEESSAEATFTMVDRDASWDGLVDGELQVTPTEDFEITGTTNIAPGTEITLRQRARGDAPFLLPAETDVAEDGSWAGEFDFSNREVGKEFTSSVRKGGSTVADVPGVIVEEIEAEEPFFEVDLDAPAEVETGESVDWEATITNTGEESGTAELVVRVDGDVEVEETLTVEGGASEVVTGSTVSPDTAGNLEIEAETQHDAASTTVSVVAPDPDVDDEDDIDEDVDTDDEDDIDDPDDDAQPGFGVIVALFALIGAALLALRRQH